MACVSLLWPTLALFAIASAVLAISGFCLGRAFELNRISKGYYWAEEEDEEAATLDASREGPTG